MKYLILLFLLSLTLDLSSQGDIGSTLPTTLGKSKVSAFRELSCILDSAGKVQYSQTFITVIFREGKKKPVPVPKDSTERITRYLIYNAKGDLLCDSWANGKYTQRYTYDEKSRIIQNLRIGHSLDTIKWDRKGDTVICTKRSGGKPAQLYFIIVENKKAQPLKIFLPEQEKKDFLYSEYTYNENNFLTDEIFYTYGSGTVWSHYKYETNKDGLFTKITCKTTQEPVMVVTYTYDYYK